jgi:F-type H+-transporting ATPase subunit a
LHEEIVTSQTSLGADAAETTDGENPTPAKSSRRSLWIGAALVVIVDVIALIFAAPTGFPDPKQTILQNLEPVPPNVVWDLAPPPAGSVATSSPLVVEFHPSITSSIIASWVVIVALLIVSILMTRSLKSVPGRAQNAFEYVYEAFAGFAEGLGGPRARRYTAIFAAFFLFIMFANWSDLILFGDKVNVLRTPTSDINITIGMALVVFVVTHIEGFRELGFLGYAGKFINLSGFRHGIANGFIDLYVGLIEFLLEFFKPVTLAFRLFGNLYGGGIMLGVFTALIIAFVPIPFIALEGFIGFIQALIFASLTLMYVLTATEAAHSEEETSPGTLESEGAAPVPAH